MQSQVYILFAAAAVMFLVIGGLSLLAHYYTLNGIKSRTVGDGQHGTARLPPSRKSKASTSNIPFQPELWRKGQNLPAVSEQGIISAAQERKIRSRRWWIPTTSTVS
jgi:type IV secretion system protein VirD4